ncbi:MAG: hypothetical protein IJ833_01005 [Lachnospiraceae bacterium]|nr:hypothetical protein [Lachnospiraceae bacterium]
MKKGCCMVMLLTVVLFCGCAKREDGEWFGQETVIDTLAHGIAATQEVKERVLVRQELLKEKLAEDRGEEPSRKPEGNVMYEAVTGEKELQEEPQEEPVPLVPEVHQGDKGVKEAEGDMTGTEEAEGDMTGAEEAEGDTTGAEEQPKEPEQESMEDVETDGAVPCEHDFQKVSWPNAATCTMEGSYTFRCAKCGEEDGTGTHTQPVLPHDYVAVESQHGNCVEHTRITYTCSGCGISYVDAHTEPDEHDWTTGWAEVWNEEDHRIDTVVLEYCTRCHLQR